VEALLSLSHSDSKLCPGHVCIRSEGKSCSDLGRVLVLNDLPAWDLPTPLPSARRLPPPVPGEPPAPPVALVDEPSSAYNDAPPPANKKSDLPRVNTHPEDESHFDVESPPPRPRVSMSIFPEGKSYPDVCPVLVPNDPVARMNYFWDKVRHPFAAAPLAAPPAPPAPATPVVGRCRLIVSKPVLKARLVSALETKIFYTAFKCCFQFQRAPLHRGQLRGILR